MQYQEYLKDKTVAIVGSSSHLIGKDEGDFIDSHDVIVRANNSSVILPELHKDYGSRTDVGYFWHSIMRFSPYQKSVSQKMKYVFLSENRHTKFDIPVCAMRKDIDWLKSHSIPYVSDMEYFQYLCYLECKISPAAGMISIYHLLRNSLKSLYVTGFSFHKESTIEFGQDDRYRICSNKEFVEKCGQYIGVGVRKMLHITEDEHKAGKREFYGHKGKIIVKDGENYLILWDRPKNFSLANVNGSEELCHPDSIRIGCHNSFMEEKVFFKWVASDPRIKLDSYLSNL